MIKLYLFIELLGASNAEAAAGEIRKLQLTDCTVKNVVQLAEDKLIAHIDCKTGEGATRMILEKLMSVEGVVQTNIIAAVRPKDSN